MAVAKLKAEKAFAEGKGVSDCPYTGKSWRSCWVGRLQELQQQDLFAELTN